VETSRAIKGFAHASSDVRGQALTGILSMLKLTELSKHVSNLLHFLHGFLSTTSFHIFDSLEPSRNSSATQRGEDGVFAAIASSSLEFDFVLLTIHAVRDVSFEVGCGSSRNIHGQHDITGLTEL
jgi:hypothetical protein